MVLLCADGTLGSVIGGFVTYRLVRKGGKETHERKFPAKTLQKVYKIVFGIAITDTVVSAPDLLALV